MRPANKHALADAIWVLMPKDVVEPTGQSQYDCIGWRVPGAPNTVAAG